MILKALFTRKFLMTKLAFQKEVILIFDVVLPSTVRTILILCFKLLTTEITRKNLSKNSLIFLTDITNNMVCMCLLRTKLPMTKLTLRRQYQIALI